MNLTLSRQQTALLVLLAILTVLFITFTLLSAAAHINVLHFFTSDLPDIFIRRP